MTRGGTRPGAGRPRSDDPRRSLTVRLSAGERAALEAYADERCLSLSEAVGDAIARLPTD
jgi:hypothetical protein